MEISTHGQRSRLPCLLALGLLALSVTAQAQNPFAKGPDPTATSIAADGPFAVSTQTVSGNGFGGGTVYSPNTAGTYALVAFCPGFTATQSSVAVMGRRLATHGFVVVTINTNSTLDQPASRATQLIAALNTVAALSTGPVAGKVDATRRAVTGHSMGGGGSLIAAKNNASLKAAIGLAPWSSDRNFASDAVPSSMIGGSADIVAPPSQHSTLFYNSIPAGTRKLHAIISGAGHGFPQNSPANQPASKYQIAWAKRFADNDTRYSQFLVTDSRLSTFSSNGPF